MAIIAGTLPSLYSLGNPPPFLRVYVKLSMAFPSLVTSAIKLVVYILVHHTLGYSFKHFILLGFLVEHFTEPIKKKNHDM